MTRSSMSTLPKATRRGIKEGSRPLTLKAPVFTTSDWPSQTFLIQKLEQERKELEAESCTCDRTEFPCCSDCAYWSQCWRCFHSEELSWECFHASDLLQYLKSEYSSIPTFSAEEVSTKGAKKDRSCWNHAPTRHRLQGAAAKRRRASACASKLEL